MTFKRWRTVDRESSDVHTTTRISGKRSLTPEGFLLCEAVPLARIGEMLYAAGELPLDPGPDGIIRVTRDAAALFSAEALASYNGKPIIVDHPEGVNIDTKNWRKHVVGVVLNPRRGTGDDADVVLVDLLIQDAEAIAEVQENGRVEVSAGYEADYEQTGVGAARQANIIGNHVALVERGRCGPRCAIGDHQPKEKDEMATQTPKKTRRVILADSIRKAFADAGEQVFGALSEGGVDDDDGGPGGADSHTHIHIHNGAETDGPANNDALAGGDITTTDETQGDPLDARLTALEASVAKIVEMMSGGAPAAEAKTGDEDGTLEDEVKVQDGMPEEVEAAKGITTGDSVALETSFRAVMADAEILAPGYRMPTFDSKATRKSTMDSMCQVRRGILTHMQMTQDGAATLNAVAGKIPDLAAATCAAVASMFRTAAAAKRIANNAVATADSRHMPAPAAANRYNPQGGKPLTLAQVNAQNREHYAKSR